MSPRSISVASVSYLVTLSAVYFSWLLTLVNVLLSFVPSVVAAPIIATLMSAAMRPYSIAVAPASSLRNAETEFWLNMGYSVISATAA